MSALKAPLAGWRVMVNVGVQPLIGKQLAIVSDARLGYKSNLESVAERLLSISGEDALTVDRKYREPWTGQLRAN